MPNTIRTGAVYRSRAYDRHLDLRHVSGIGTALMTVALLLVPVTLYFPGWWA